MSQLSLFSGDFDGDGRADFVQLGRGKRVSDPPRPGGLLVPREARTWPSTSREEPRDLSLVQIRDLDGDSRSDLLIVQPQRASEEGFVPPVRLELYLSGGGK